MTSVAVTGVSSPIGRRIAEALEAHGDVTRVVGIDAAPPGFATRNLEYYRTDVRHAAARDVLSGCARIIHVPGDAEGTRNLLRCADDASVEHVVIVSSALAYGAHADNDVPLTEDAPLRPNRAWPASADAAATEEVVDAFRESAERPEIAVLRCAPVVGATARGMLMRLLEAPVLLGVRGHNPPVQVVDERDLAAAAVFASDRRLNGAFNVAAEGWVPYSRFGELAGRRLVELDADAVRRLMDALHAWGVSDVPAGAVALLMHPCVVSGERLRAAGFSPSRSTPSAILDAAEARRGWVSVGKLRFRPRNAAALAGAAAVGASLVAHQAWRRLGPGAARA